MKSLEQIVNLLVGRFCVVQRRQVGDRLHALLSGKVGHGSDTPVVRVVEVKAQLLCPPDGSHFDCDRLAGVWVERNDPFELGILAKGSLDFIGVIFREVHPYHGVVRRPEPSCVPFKVSLDQGSDQSCRHLVARLLNNLAKSRSSLTV